MRLREKFLKDGLLLSAGQAVTQLSSFIRNVIVARYLGAENFGTAALLSMTVVFMEMLSNLASEQLLIQAENGNDPLFQKTAQFVLAGRGCFLAALIFGMAGPIVWLFNVPNAISAFRMLAIVPLLRGFIHIDMTRMQREMHYGRIVLVEIGSSILVTFAAVPLVLWRRDYSAVLWVLVMQSAIFMGLSHVVAQRHYRWGWKAAYARQIFNFGWPLLVNGLLMFGIFQGDRLVIGASSQIFGHDYYTLADLGVYSVVFALTMAPTLVVSRVCSALFLPLLSRVQQDRYKFIERYCSCVYVVCLLAGGIAVSFVMLGDWMITAMYGEQYITGAAVVGWLAAMQALRIIRTAPTLAAMANADTKNAMISNLTRALGFIGVGIAVYSMANMRWIAIAGLLGEILALFVCVYRIQRLYQFPASLCVNPSIISGTVVALGWVMGRIISDPSLFVKFVWLAVLFVILMLSMFLLFPQFRELFVIPYRSLILQTGSEIWKFSFHRDGDFKS